MEYIPRLFDVDDSERTEDELAALHQVGNSVNTLLVDFCRCSSYIVQFHHFEE